MSPAEKIIIVWGIYVPSEQGDQSPEDWFPHVHLDDPHPRQNLVHRVDTLVRPRSNNVSESEKKCSSSGSTLSEETRFRINLQSHPHDVPFVTCKKNWPKFSESRLFRLRQLHDWDDRVSHQTKTHKHKSACTLVFQTIFPEPSRLERTPQWKWRKEEKQIQCPCTTNTWWFHIRWVQPRNSGCSGLPAREQKRL